MSTAKALKNRNNGIPDYTYINAGETGRNCDSG